MSEATVTTSAGVQAAILELLRSGLERGVWDAVLVPARVPAGDSFAWLLMQDSALLSEATPLPPIISVQGARALSRFARRGVMGRVAVAMRPCEVRATIELAKLNQVDVSDLVLISMDCPGALPLKPYIEDPQRGDERFERLLAGDDSVAREVCRVCHHFSRPASDLHFATLGVNGDGALLVAGSDRGRAVLSDLEMSEATSLDSWQRAVAERQGQRKQARTVAHAALAQEIAGPDRFLSALSHCVNCRVCRGVCPICHCRQCQFESRAVLMPPDNILARARRKGGMRLPTNTLLFHLGRMSHMSLSCVSCGACEDACPSGIPIAQIFSLVSDAAQRQFDCEAGRDRAEPLPTTTFAEDELSEIVAPYVEMHRAPGETS